MDRVKHGFYWPRCQFDVQMWCARCLLCSSKKGPNPRQKAPLGKYLVGAPMERIAIDVMGPFVLSDRGNRYLLVAMDYFSKWPEAFPLPTQEAKVVAEVLVNEFVCRFGVPLELHSDQGTNFESVVFREMCSLLGIKKTRTTALHPQSDGMVERYNRTLKTQLSLFVEEHQRDWDKHVPLLLMAYRTAVHNATKFTPACLMMGHEIRVPVDLAYGRPQNEPTENYPQFVQDLKNNLETVHEFARTNLEFSYEKMKKSYNTDSSANVLEKGDLVWLFNPRRRKGRSPKLSRPWQGPFVIIKRLNDLVYRIRLNPQAKPKVVHRNRLWKYTGDQAELWADESTSSVLPTNENSSGSETEIGAVEAQTAPSTSQPLRRSGRKRKPRTILDL